jgi:ferredoxin-like protein FixX
MKALNNEQNRFNKKKRNKITIIEGSEPSIIHTGRCAPAMPAKIYEKLQEALLKAQGPQ